MSLGTSWDTLSVEMIKFDPNMIELYGVFGSKITDFPNFGGLYTKNALIENFFTTCTVNTIPRTTI